MSQEEKNLDWSYGMAQHAEALLTGNSREHEYRTINNLNTLLWFPSAILRGSRPSEFEPYYVVVAKGGERLATRPLPGDILLRVIEGGHALASVLVQPDIKKSDVLQEKLTTRLYPIGGFVHVIERFTGKSKSSDKCFRQLTDTVGRVLSDLTLIRLVLPQMRVPVPKTRTVPLIGQLENMGEADSAHIDTEKVIWTGATAAQISFMRQVYLLQVNAAAKVRTFVNDIPASDRAEIESGATATIAAAESCRRLLADARAALESEGGISKSIGVVRGYSSASTQLSIWNSNFPKYFKSTAQQRASAVGGELGEAAANLTARYIAARLAAPGYSLHNSGLAIDFATKEGGKTLTADSSKESLSAWKKSWFFSWMLANATSFYFFQNEKIDEPWHWEFRAPAMQESIDAAELISITPAGSMELRNTPILKKHNGTQPDLFIKWNEQIGSGAVDVVVHFHGHSKQGRTMTLQSKAKISGLDFANPTNPSDTRTGRFSSTVCILPRGSWNPLDETVYTFPALNNSSGLTSLIEFALKKYRNATGSDAPRGRTILTAHSGGGEALLNILRDFSPDEIYVFDALYWDPKSLIQWINAKILSEVAAWSSDKSKADSAMCVFYTGGKTQRLSDLVNKALSSALETVPTDVKNVLEKSYRVLRTSVSHDVVASTYGWLLLADSTIDLPNTAPG